LAIDQLVDLTVGDRPASRLTEGFSSVIFLNGYFSVCLFLSLSSMALLGFLLMFSSPINSETVEKPINKFEQVFINLQQDLIIKSRFSLFLKRFSFEPKFHTLDF